MVYGFLGVIIFSLCGTGYFAIWRLTDETHSDVKKSRNVLFKSVQFFNSIRKIIENLDQRLLELENEIRQQKSDSSRLVEWLDKERLIRDADRTDFLKIMTENLKLSQREEKISEIGEALKLIKSRIKTK